MLLIQPACCIATLSIVLFSLDNGPNTDIEPWNVLSDPYIGRTTLEVYGMRTMGYYTYGHGQHIAGIEGKFYTKYPKWVECLVDRAPWFEGSKWEGVPVVPPTMDEYHSYVSHTLITCIIRYSCSVSLCFTFSIMI